MEELSPEKGRKNPHTGICCTGCGKQYRGKMRKRGGGKNRREGEEGIGVKVLRDEGSKSGLTSEKGKVFDCIGEREKRGWNRKGLSASALTRK
jgi:hypothetical protein